jgi:hypothetical protein
MGTTYLKPNSSSRMEIRHEKMSRRAALGSVAATATALVGLGAKPSAAEPATAKPGPGLGKTERPVTPMTLEEFQRMNSPVGVEELFSHVEGHTFMMCHRDMKEKHGIWIPELVPVFEKLDAMRAKNG